MEPPWTYDQGRQRALRCARLAATYLRDAAPTREPHRIARPQPELARSHLHLRRSCPRLFRYVRMYVRAHVREEIGPQHAAKRQRRVARGDHVTALQNPRIRRDVAIPNAVAIAAAIAIEIDMTDIER